MGADLIIQKMKEQKKQTESSIPEDSSTLKINRRISLLESGRQTPLRVTKTYQDPDSAGLFNKEIEHIDLPISPYFEFVLMHEAPNKYSDSQPNKVRYSKYCRKHFQKHKLLDACHKMSKLKDLIKKNLS